MPRLHFLTAISVTLWLSSNAISQETYLLKESFEVGTAYRVATRSQLSGSITIPVGEGKPAKTVPIRGLCTTNYSEEILPDDKKIAERRTLRIYETIDFRKAVADVDQSMRLRPAIKQMVFLEKEGKRLPFSPAAPLTWNEIEFLRTETFVPALMGLLPGKEVKVLDTWKLPSETARDLTDLEKVEDNNLIGRFVQVTTLNGRQVGELSLSGSARGVNEDGPTKHTLKGSVFFDLQSKVITYVSILGEQHLFDSKGEINGKLEGRFVLTREPREAFSLRKIAAVSASDILPNESNTRLLYEIPELGFSFQYPRRWHINQTRGRQITVDEPGGSGVLFTIDPMAKLPSAERYQKEVSDFFRDRKVPIRVVNPIHKFTEFANAARFTLEVQESNARPTLDYYVIAGRSYGATVAGRIVGADSDALRKDVETMVRTIKFKD
ncbi:hypothetical protein KIH39_05695 [Telmatocola sphagniphila]|uniref:Uncharacterized protein n=1 Tax=Telmatocola sphagniphila TaxID=1123043 RepID=A0A8E6B7Y2_9BACT|nr:hypothetical protein [Telmatocola sphagniphila]QVL33406.1 hypothetical protein KIH39_05695 [Telmatocola sphagniphila]